MTGAQSRNGPRLSVPVVIKSCAKACWTRSLSRLNSFAELRRLSHRGEIRPMKDVSTRAGTRKIKEHDLRVRQHVSMMLQKLNSIAEAKRQEE